MVKKGYYFNCLPKYVNMEMLVTCSAVISRIGNSESFSQSNIKKYIRYIHVCTYPLENPCETVHLFLVLLTFIKIW